MSWYVPPTLSLPEEVGELHADFLPQWMRAAEGNETNNHAEHADEELEDPFAGMEAQLSSQRAAPPIAASAGPRADQRQKKPARKTSKGPSRRQQTRQLKRHMREVKETKGAKQAEWTAWKKS